MAPRFTQNMFNCWESGDSAEALVCLKFPRADELALAREHIQFVRLLVDRVSEGKPWRKSALDWIGTEPLGRNREGLFVGCFPAPECPDLRIRSSAELSYAVEIQARALTLGNLESKIVETARELSIEMPRNKLLVNLDWVVRSNLEYSLREVRGWAREIACVSLATALFWGLPGFLFLLLLAWLWPTAGRLAFGVLVAGLSALLVRSVMGVMSWRRAVKEARQLSSDREEGAHHGA